MFSKLSKIAQDFESIIDGLEHRVPFSQVSLVISKFSNHWNLLTNHVPLPLPLITSFWKDNLFAQTQKKETE